MKSKIKIKIFLSWKLYRRMSNVQWRFALLILITSEYYVYISIISFLLKKSIILSVRAKKKSYQPKRLQKIKELKKMKTSFNLQYVYSPTCSSVEHQSSNYFSNTPARCYLSITSNKLFISDKVDLRKTHRTSSKISPFKCFRHFRAEILPIIEFRNWLALII